MSAAAHSSNSGPRVPSLPTVVFTFLLGGPLLIGPVTSLMVARFEMSSIIGAPLLWWLSAFFPKTWFVTLIPTIASAVLVWLSMRGCLSRLPFLFTSKARIIVTWTLGSALVSALTAVCCAFVSNGVPANIEGSLFTTVVVAPISAILGLCLGVASTLNEHVRLRQVAGLVCGGGMVLVGVALVISLIPSFYDLNGPPIHVQVDSTSLCVPRRFIMPSDLEQHEKSSGPITEWYHGPSVALSLFTRELVGQTNEQYAALRKDPLDKRVYSGDWVKIEIIPQRRLYPARIAPNDFLQSFDETWQMDGGFRAHRRRRDCVGQSLQWAALSAVTLGPECLDTMLLYGHASAPEVTLQCNSERCATLTRFSKDGVHFEYNFPRSYLADFPAVHMRALERIAQWRTDTSCRKNAN